MSFLHISHYALLILVQCFYKIIFFQLTKVLYFFLDLIVHRSYWSELMRISDVIMSEHFQNYQK